MLTIQPEEKQTKIISNFVSSINSHKKEEILLMFPDGTSIPLPETLIKILLVSSEALTRNHAVTVIARSDWLTTQEAAELMGYSRQVVIDLINKNKLKASKLGTHRRIKLADLMEFMNQEDIQRSKAMSELITHTEEFNGYELGAWE